ncbi:hypothetical protein ANCCEY_04461 [Ancylostoma ceylanicum]|uniref:Voltage-dependent L-type calcium channel subunit beta-1-4 N-terminal A domain-containing protein n=1 Tax=Ancylostoma ceylanicum TaxID=53326 RepID=A0A0D6M9F2_9BILA|nr:hypothetical protein ANCCEY_04461 [Ancylostoma ceylanicum]
MCGRRPCAFVRPGMAGFTHRSRRGSGDSNYSHRDDDLELEAGNRETLRRDAERQAALQLERAKRVKPITPSRHNFPFLTVLISSFSSRLATAKKCVPLAVLGVRFAWILDLRLLGSAASSVGAVRQSALLLRASADVR